MTSQLDFFLCAVSCGSGQLELKKTFRFYYLTSFAKTKKVAIQPQRVKSTLGLCAPARLFTPPSPHGHYTRLTANKIEKWRWPQPDIISWIVRKIPSSDYYIIDVFETKYCTFRTLILDPHFPLIDTTFTTIIIYKFTKLLWLMPIAPAWRCFLSTTKNTDLLLLSSFV